MIFQELLIYCKLKAYEDLLNPSEETLWRSITRAYSEKFHVPLPQVRQMDPEAVISEILEARYEDTDAFEDIESILEDIYTLEDPAYQQQQKAEMDMFIKNVEQREKRRLAQEKEKEKNQRDVLRQQPKAGSVDFTKLKNET